MRKRIAFITATIMMCISVAACGGNKEKKSEDTSTSAQDQEVSKDEQLYNDLFDINNMVSIQVDISDEELDKIQQDYKDYDAMGSKSPIYRIADKVTITVGDEVYEIDEVGIKLKGNTTREPIYDEESGDLNLSHYKLSFNETFDDPEEYGADAKVWSSDEEKAQRKDRTFATLKSLEMKWNNNYDTTYVREYYAYSMFRDYGILAPQNNISSLSLNGENYGVYKIYEPVDKVFIERNLPEEDWGGDLYKCGWTYSPANYDLSTTYGIEDKDLVQFYNYDLKTNKSSSKHESIENLLDVVNDGSCTKEQFESVIDTQYFAKFLALSYFTGNPDDMRNDFNNHYVYFCKSTGKAIFIPYDYDRCLGITRNWNPDGTGMTEVSPYSDYAEGNQRKQSNPLIKLAILDKDYCLDDYNKDLAEVASGKWLTEENFEQVYDAAKANYEKVVKPTYDFADAIEEEFKFSLDGEYTTGDKSNMSAEEYFKRILDTYNKEKK